MASTVNPDDKDLEDPWNWSMERLIYEFCQNPQPIWAAETKPELMPKPAVFEEAIRTHLLDGESLMAMEMADIASELKITAFGVKRNLFKAIKYLRNTSVECQRQKLTAHVMPYLQGMPRDFGSPQIPASNTSGFGNHTPNVPYPSPRISNLNDTTAMSGAAGGTRQETVHQTECLSPSIPSNPSQMIALHTTQDLLRTDRSADNNTTRDRVQSPGSILAARKLGGEEHAVSRNVRNADTELLQNATTQDRTNPRELEVGSGEGKNSNKVVLQIDRVPLAPTGRRRIAPTFVSQISGKRARALAISGSKQHKLENPDNLSSEALYLDRSSQQLEDSFYPIEYDLDTRFEIVQSDLPSGQRLHTAEMMKSFLRSTVHKIKGTKTLYRLPYSKSRLRPDASQQFSLFLPGLEAVKQTLKDWPTVESGQTVKKQRTQHSSKALISEFSEEDSENQLKVPEESAHDLGLEEYLDYLEQRYPVDDNEEGLAIYGESGDEGGYDTDTWDEINAERNDRKKLPDPTIMTSDQVDTTIDGAIDEIKATWREKKLMKVQVKAYRLWNRANSDGSCLTMIENSIFRTNHLDQSILKLRGAIKNHHIWHTDKVSELKQLCATLDESVCQKEEHHHYVSVLFDPQAPPRPDPISFSAQKKSDRLELADGEEILESDTDLSMNEFLAEESSEAEDIPYEVPHSPSKSKQNASQQLLQSDSEASSSYPHGLSTHKSPVANFMAADEQDEVMADVEDSDPEDSDDRIISPSRRRQITQFSHSQQKTPPSASPTDAEETDSERDSDFDALAPLPKTKYRKLGRTILEPIELLSSPSAPERSDRDSTTDFDVQTPELNPEETLSPQANKIKPTLKVSEEPFTPSRNEKSSRRFKLTQPTPEEHVKHNGIEAVQAMSWEIIESRYDDRHTLAKVVYDLSLVEALVLRKYVEKLVRNQDKASEVMVRALSAISESIDEIEDVSAKHQKSARYLILLLLSYNEHADRMDEMEISNAEIDRAYSAMDEGLMKFWAALRLVLDAYCKAQPTEKKRGEKRKASGLDSNNNLADDSDLYLMQHNMQNAAESDGEPQEQGTQSAFKRKKKVKESQEAINQQHDDQLRVAEQERRKALLQAKMKHMSMNNDDDPSSHAIAFIEPIIFIDAHIGGRLKPHQEAGIQFMWREITSGGGCLLAHTMGLGKTMQVISLLVTIAQSSNSDDPAVRRQVPEGLRDSKTLILCPPTLVDNWHDELLMWTPPGMSELGELRKIISGSKPPERIREIRAWSQSGGVLLISYSMFRGLISNQRRLMADELHKELKGILLTEPNIVVADEAHSMKNATSKLSLAAKEFKTAAKIALTGSPLSNHLEEYHQMIDWIQPGYLGDLVQFKAKYSEPIALGLFSDSSSYERRVSARKLVVLKKDLDPKICRADISAIAKDMPSKAEFFITIPLADLQRDAYTTYVKHLLRDHSDSATPSMARLFDWLAVLSLLVNHPSAFFKKVEDRSRDTDVLLDTEKCRHASEDTEVGAPDDVAISNLGLSEELLQQSIGIFQQMTRTHMEDYHLSHRSLLVARIVKASMKIKDKVLIFSHSIPTLNYLEKMLTKIKCNYVRIDGQTSMRDRQQIVKNFNSENDVQAFLISTKAGGLGLNLQGANRVIIYDFGFNPTWEEQAVGRAYRLGQQKQVFVYRFRTGGTFEEAIYNKSIFKTQLFARVVDKRNPMRHASKKLSDYLFEPRDVPQADISGCMGTDTRVLDKVLAKAEPGIVRNVELTETFQIEEDEELTAEDLRQAEEEYKDQVLERTNPQAFAVKMREQADMQSGRQPQATYRSFWPGNAVTNYVRPPEVPQGGTSEAMLPEILETLRIPNYGSNGISEVHGFFDEHSAGAKVGNGNAITMQQHASTDDTNMEINTRPPRSNSVEPPRRMQIDGTDDERDDQCKIY